MFKKYFEGKKAVFFDLDGTIVKETEELKKQAFEKVLKDLDASYIDPKPYCISGYPLKDCWKAILYANELPEKKSIKELVEKTREVYLEIIKNSDIKPLEGFWDLIYELKTEKNLKIGLTTNTNRATQEVVSQKLGISDIFDVIICGDEVRKPKPHPEMYKKALKKLGIKPKEALVFEDSFPGVESAGKAGIDTLVIWDGETRKSNYKGKVIDFTSDFTPFPGKLDETHVEYLARKYEEAKENK